ncbi:MAG: adenosine monophosphate-protein transferase [Candidatus Methanomethylicota archaeon]|uniref:Adenosine monophosphate-protein transferase n=1 Tax=Thermoproteota archaeon TaxID=2056631 RepID=A0A497F3F8_9CREN|nr:MAG: adenosine monophosphate-protein transferase [Candidatus Verstraetearchaeota archaeon]RLE53420.1 MAG: adenosine monophosphate-protein transferase [Candidatus Verstraetearchaeota archaeon]
MEIKSVKMEIPEGCNIIIGQAHFIKTTEDLYEALVNSVPGIKFGLAFNESSGPCLVRSEGNDEQLREIAVKNALAIGAGHCFVILIKNAYPINVLNAIKRVPEVVTLYCATANPVEVIVADTGDGAAILGVADGLKPKGVERPENIEERRKFLRKIGYKL